MPRVTCGPPGRRSSAPKRQIAAAWTKTYLAILWDGKAEAVVSELVRLQDDSERLKPVREARHYLEKTLDMVRYAAFRAGGYPIGGGIVESANKLVVEARLQGAGKHWAPANVNGVLALRCSIANVRWKQDWRNVQTALRRPHHQRPLKPISAERAPAPESDANTQPAIEPAVPGKNYVKTFEDGKPTPGHPWKSSRPSRAKS